LILPPAVLALPKLGCFNIHASLLPRWRGGGRPFSARCSRETPRPRCRSCAWKSRSGHRPGARVREVQIGEREPREACMTGSHPRRRALVETLDAVAAAARRTVQSPVGITYAEKITKGRGADRLARGSSSVLRRVRASTRGDCRDKNE